MKLNRKRQVGAAVIFIVGVLLLAAGYTAMYTTRFMTTNQKMTGGFYAKQQALEAAQAGLQFGIQYLSANQNTIVVDSNSNGFVDAFSNASTSNVVLANGARYTITYSNPTSANFNILMVSSAGQSADGTATKTVSMLVSSTSSLSHFDPVSIQAKGNITLTGNTTITNVYANTTIRSGGTVTFSGNAETILASGPSSEAGNIKSDVVQNNSTLQGYSTTQFFNSYFGAGKAAAKAASNMVYTSSSNVNYSSTLNGVTGRTIFLDHSGGGTATLTGNTTIGSVASPVILIVDGPFSVSGNVNIFGLVFTTGTGNVNGSGNAYIRGSLVSSGTISESGNFNAVYDGTVMSRLMTLGGSFTPIPASWRDF